ncbi:unnamed protein product [Ixodes pacificus]
MTVLIVLASFAFSTLTDCLGIVLELNVRSPPLLKKNVFRHFHAWTKQYLCHTVVLVGFQAQSSHFIICTNSTGRHNVQTHLRRFTFTSSTSTSTCELLNILHILHYHKRKLHTLHLANKSFIHHHSRHRDTSFFHTAV